MPIEIDRVQQKGKGDQKGKGKGKDPKGKGKSKDDKLGRAKVQKLPCGQEILEPDETCLYRSLAGCGICFPQESFTVKELASKMACPLQTQV